MSDIDFITDVRQAETKADNVRLAAELSSRETMEQARQEASNIINEAHHKATTIKRDAEILAVAEAKRIAATPFPIELEFTEAKINAAADHAVERIVKLLGNC